MKIMRVQVAFSPSQNTKFKQNKNALSKTEFALRLDIFRVLPRSNLV